jgi:hypothetical protein
MMSETEVGTVKISKSVKHGKTVVNSAYSNPKFVEDFPKGREVEFSYDEYDNDESAKATLKTGELADLVNAREKANARSAAIAKATADYKPAQDDPAEIRKRMIRDYMLSNKKLTEEQAGALADKMLAHIAEMTAETASA